MSIYKESSTSRDSRISFNFVRDVFVSLSSGVQWLLNELSQDSDDLNTLCERVLLAKMISELGLYKFEVSSGVNDMTANDWFESNTANTTEKLSISISKYIRHLEAISQTEKAPRYEEESTYLGELARFLRSCETCEGIRFKCLYLLRDILSVVTALPQLMRYERGIDAPKRIAVILERTFQEGKMTGWPCYVDYAKESEVDAYITINIIKSIDQSTYHPLFSLREKIHSRQIALSLINTLIELQQRDGSWLEGFWGGQQIKRVKSTAKIAQFLQSRAGRDAKENIARAISFVRGAFGQQPFCVNPVTHQDLQFANRTDIQGTIYGLELELEIGVFHETQKLEHPDILEKVKWLLAQQRQDGSWPILSHRLWKQYRKDNKHLRGGLEKLEGHEKCNTSPSNTTAAISVLVQFAKKCVSSGISS